MSACERHREHFSDDLEGVLDAAERRRLRGHLRRCARCRLLHAEMKALLEDLPALAEPLPEGLGERLAGRTGPACRPLAARTSHAARPTGPARPTLIAWRRAAAWAVVFVGAWWQLAGGAVTSFASDRIIPGASSAVADVRESAARRAASGEGVLGRLGRVSSGLSELSQSANRTLFGGEEGTAPVSPTSPTESPVPSAPSDPSAATAKPTASGPASASQE